MIDKSIYTSIEQEEGPGPCKCIYILLNYLAIEGYIVYVSGIHEECQEDQIYELFSEYGNIKNLHVNLDRKTGYLKGYALIEYENLQEAQKVVNKLNGHSFLGRKINVNFAFKKPPEIEERSK